MKTRRLSFLLALVVVLIIASLYWLVPLSRTSQAAPAPAADTAFKGKVLLVNTKTMSAFLLEKAQVRKLGDQSSLVGKGAEEGQMMGWAKGRTMWLPMENIVTITEFDDLKEAKKAMESGAANPFGGFGMPVLETPKTAPPGGDKGPLPPNDPRRKKQ
jgi:hypothetical protein